MKLQELMKQRIICNRAQKILLRRKFDIVIKAYFINEEAKRVEFESKVQKIKDAKKRALMTKKIPAPKELLPDAFVSRGIEDWIIKNRQIHVTKSMQYEEVSDIGD